ncbi:MAG: A/G-specific adenine glycosylase [Taibaiella sp.]|nr:A/G-specific adenine glycosylase [Taibaiella sp.]
MANPDESISKQALFTRRLLEWHRTVNTRDLPWKGEKDPYRIWLSEIILQQTRAQQGLPYYHAFTTQYPTVHDLAAAKDDDVFRVWQGLGYYNRCRNMLATARYISDELSGAFPSTYEGLLSLKGIGPYTAAAIGSFAFGLPTAVLDGNVYRVLSRYFGIETPSDSSEGKAIFTSLAAELVSPKESALYNQAIMDLGATVCTPANPKCEDCPVASLCFARSHDAQAIYPVRTKKINVTERHFNYLVIVHNDQIWVNKRAEGDIWANLFELLLIETPKQTQPAELQKALKTLELSVKDIERHTFFHSKQRLTHQLIHSYFYSVSITEPDRHSLPGMGRWVSINELKNLAFPKTLVSFFRKNLYF